MIPTTGALMGSVIVNFFSSLISLNLLSW